MTGRFFFTIRSLRVVNEWLVLVKNFKFGDFVLVLGCAHTCLGLVMAESSHIFKRQSAPLARDSLAQLCNIPLSYSIQWKAEQRF